RQIRDKRRHSRSVVNASILQEQVIHKNPSTFYFVGRAQWQRLKSMRQTEPEYILLGHALATAAAFHQCASGDHSRDPRYWLKNFVAEDHSCSSCSPLKP